MQIQSFKEFPLSREVLRGIEDLGFRNLSPIQAQSIGPLLEGRDVIGQAQTGTGKTAAFGIPMIEQLNPYDRQVQGLVLAPTRELAIQTAEHLKQISKYKKLKILPVYGGTPINKQISALRKGVHIVVGTPGRIIDHIKRGTLKLRTVTHVVLDEADRMLDMGFIKDIEFILGRVPKDKQISLFSATMDKNVWKVCNHYMQSPEKILVSKDEITLEEINQFYVVVNPKQKFQALVNVLDEYSVERAILFCRTRRGADRTAKNLKGLGYGAKSLHGGLSQPQRDRVVDEFKKAKVKLLVATDVAARGLDIQDITHIINYDIPNETNSYFHRIGRTARMKKRGMAITLVENGQMSDLKDIKRQTKTNIKELKTEFTSERRIPSYTATCAKCGVECQLPFKPNGNRPVYCQKCYHKQLPARNSRRRY